MKNFWLSMLAVTIMTVGAFSFSSMYVEAEPDETNDVRLTDEQKEEMAILQKEAFDQHKKIVNKYVEFGVYSEERGEKILDHIEEMHQKLEANGYIPQWDKKHKKRQE